MIRKYEVISYDVWGNARDGFEVNAAYSTGRVVEITFKDTAHATDYVSDYAINRRVGVRGVTWDGDPDYSLYGEVKRNGRPALELRAIREN